MDELVIGNRKISNRLFIGTGKYGSYQIMKEALEEAAAEVVTVALRRIDTSSNSDNPLDYIPKNCILMPNTSGARNAEEAVRIARIAKMAGCGNWVKIEIISDQKYLLPDNIETMKATKILADEGFVVLPYMNPDLTVARKLVEAGAAAVMPLGSPIGSNRGLKTKEMVRILVEEMPVPVIVDAGIGRPSEAAECMEMGCAAVLVNTAIATARDPKGMARAFKDAVSAGRLAYLSGTPPSQEYASASSPLTGFLRNEKQ
jgi:thiazole synthase